ncbi:Sodium-coupled monocarboxylate transporter 1, partial [Araneus ventricosus]
MKFDQHLGLTDSIVVIMSLLVPSAIGIFFRFSSGRQKTMDEYFFAGRSASKIPVIMSITASSISSVAILGTSSEVYKFGCVLGTFVVPAALGTIISCYVFLPVYFQCNVSSVYEYLEMRFGKLTRCTVLFMYNIQMTLYSSCVLYGPALVLNSVSNISVELAIILCGGVCTFYCFLGGLKAVLW